MDWDVIAGVAAAVTALVLHLLHVVEVDLILTIILVLLALLLIRDLRRENLDERLMEDIQTTRSHVEELDTKLVPAEAILVGPRDLREVARRFCETARGEMIWFNVCFAMFRRQEVFDSILRPAIENPQVEAIQFVSDRSEAELWDRNLLPKLDALPQKRKVKVPRWSEIPHSVSFILAEIAPGGETEALVSFWGEPFMARTTGQDVPRYIFRIKSHSDLIARLVELERQIRINT